VYGTEGKKYEGKINGFEFESECGLLKTTARGLTEQEIAEFTELGEEELVGSVFELKCSGLSHNSDGEWSLLHPSVVERRTDKDTCDTLESCQEIEQMAKGLTKEIK
jgi:hypothetical protein